jgi:hypothetical protein
MPTPNQSTMNTKAPFLEIFEAITALKEQKLNSSGAHQNNIERAKLLASAGNLAAKELNSWAAKKTHPLERHQLMALAMVSKLVLDAASRMLLDGADAESLENWETLQKLRSKMISDFFQCQQQLALQRPLKIGTKN